MKDHHPLTTIDHHRHFENVEEEEDLPNPFPVAIFDAAFCGEPVPAGFDAVRIPLDGKLQADLSWKKELDAARVYVSKGLRIFWDIDLGLPKALNHSLSNRSQFLSLTLSLEHFCKTLWKEFRKETVGLCLFRGSLDLTQDYPWDEEQKLNLQDWMSEHYSNSEADNTSVKYFCRDVVSEYLGLLASAVPDYMPLFLLFDASDIDDPFVEAQLLNKESFSRFHLGVKTKKQFLSGIIAWRGLPTENGTISKDFNKPKHEKPSLGVCLPGRLICHPSSLQTVFAKLQKVNSHFRVISEGELAVEWNGLDDLIVDTHFVSPQFKRKLQGFCAAGGRIIFSGESLGLAEEISFDSWIHI